ncbi:MAG: GNAT family N-acetyltransferase [Colwellia sp.]|nr:GNAT family N-acetyltransferase [Colwellia sp.]MCW8864672.1 GNAT family N-acetyltransferase [Colwellia sp.]MCW9082147.1 GNAT family N-acetyltransferase [Colwellia sp.]
MHSFTTERLLIRPLAEQDKELYISLYTDEKIMRNIGSPLSQDAAEKAFDKTIIAMKKTPVKVMTWAIVNVDNNEGVGLQALNWQTPEIAEIGIMLLRHTNGRLLPEEAMGALMEYAFNYLSINIITAKYAKKNLATKRFVKKLGFTEIKNATYDNTQTCHQQVKKNQWHKQLITRVIN